MTAELGDAGGFGAERAAALRELLGRDRLPGAAESWRFSSGRTAVRVHRLRIHNVRGIRDLELRFLLTTHDGMWVQQLQSERAVRRGDAVCLRRWSLDAGPMQLGAGDLWADSDAKLAGGDVKDVARSVRYAMEEFLHWVADDLEAQVPFRIDGRLSCGELQIACDAVLKEQLARARRCAESWGAAERAAHLAHLEERRRDPAQKLGAVQWQVNPNVHFDLRADTTIEEMAEVVATLREYRGLFQCRECATNLRVDRHDGKPSKLACRCGTTSWTLQTDV
jgi:hypothetical protein